MYDIIAHADITDLLPPGSGFRDRIEKLEKEMLSHGGHPDDVIQTFDRIHGGMYIREIHIPAGTMLTGTEYYEDHVNICSFGGLSVVTDDGATEVWAPATMFARRGTKRAAIALTDCVWTTIAATPFTDIDRTHKFLYVQQLPKR